MHGTESALEKLLLPRKEGTFTHDWQPARLIEIASGWGNVTSVRRHPVKAGYDIPTDIMLVLGLKEPPHDAGTRQQESSKSRVSCQQMLLIERQS